MKKNAFTDILFNYEKMSAAKKLQKLQEFENMMARFQGRIPRIVTTKNNRFKEIIEKSKQMGRSFYAYYSRSDNKYLHIIDLKCDAMDMIKDIIHEGWHAYIDDYLNRGVTLKTFSEIDIDEFLYQQKFLPAIYDYLNNSNKINYFDWCFAEERKNYQEDSLYMAYFMLDALENLSDVEKIMSKFFICFEYAHLNEERIKNLEKEGETFKQILDKIASDEKSETIQFRKLGKVNSVIDKEFLDFANNISNHLEQAIFKSGEYDKINIDNEIFNKLIDIFNEYVSKMILTKIKNKIK